MQILRGSMPSATSTGRILEQGEKECKHEGYCHPYPALIHPLWGMVQGTGVVRIPECFFLRAREPARGRTVLFHTSRLSRR